MNKIKFSSYLIVFGLILATLLLHLVPAAFIGMLVFLITKHLAIALDKRFVLKKSRIVASLLIIFGITGIITILALFLSNALGNQENLSGLSSKVVEILTDIRLKLPPILVSYIPDGVLGLKETLANLIKEHSQELSNAGGESLHTLVHILIALAISVLLSLHQFTPKFQSKPLTIALHERFHLLSKSFENVVFAQARISAINTMLTAIFLLVVLPLTGIELPYRKTMVLVTFVVGLLPVVGNLISNTVITLISLSVSFSVAISALIFLVLIHKLEYFINARIVGDRIGAKAWELLLAMLIMESIFGVAGLLLAPVIYAYIKAELKVANLI